MLRHLPPQSLVIQSWSPLVLQALEVRSNRVELASATHRHCDSEKLSLSKQAVQPLICKLILGLSFLVFQLAQGQGQLELVYQGWKEVSHLRSGNLESYGSTIKTLQSSCSAQVLEQEYSYQARPCSRDSHIFTYLFKQGSTRLKLIKPSLKVHALLHCYV